MVDVKGRALKTPCVNHGWAHAAYTKPGEWRQRRVKGRMTDRCLAGQRVTCTECKKEYHRLKKLLLAARSQDPKAPGVTLLEAKLKATPYRFSTLTPKVNELLWERFPWLAVKLPAYVTHRTAISIEVIDEITRAARTAQSSHDLEAMYLENRGLHAARKRITFYGMQGAELAAARRSGRAGKPVVHYEAGISTISDTYITDALLEFVDSHRKYILQWSEQRIVLDTVAADHSGKRFSRMAVEGTHLLNWR